jgi:hypothetical protein
VPGLATDWLDRGQRYVQLAGLFPIHTVLALDRDLSRAESHQQVHRLTELVLEQPAVKLDGGVIHARVRRIADGHDPVKRVARRRLTAD